MTRRAALFDMDRTLIRKDTATLYTRYRRDIGAAKLSETLRVAWWMLQYTAGVVDAHAVARKALSSHAGVLEVAMRDDCRVWFPKYVLPHVCEKGREAVQCHGQRGEQIAIVTGATRYAAEPLAAELGIEHVVCSELEVDSDGRLTGQIEPPLCYAEGKLERALRWMNAQEVSLSDATFYSDSITDLPLLERVGTPIAVNPDARLRLTAKRRGWTIVAW